MSTFESSIRHIPYRQVAIYNMLSDLSNVERIADRIPSDKFKDLRFDHDRIAISAAPAGEICLHVVDREAPKCVKFETEQSPVPFNLWIQIVAVDEASSKIKLTVKADLNPFIRGMVEKPLKEALERIADALEHIRYED